MSTPVQDTIDFMLAAEATVVNTTVKMSAAISGLIGTDMTEAMLKDGIKDMMKKFIPDANWQFSNMTRNVHPSGKEEITLLATARVAETENYALEKRAREVSKEGLSITGNITVDTTPPASMIEDAESELRTRLLTKAVVELGKLNVVMATLVPEGYRISSIAYQSVGNDTANYANMARGGATMMKTAVMATSYGSGMDDDDTLGNAVKLTMRATIKLGRIVPGT